MPTRSDDPSALQEFAAALGARDPKTIATYLTTLRDFVAWLATQPGGAPFHLGLMTETAVRGYMDFLVTVNRAPRTRSKALSALRRFCQWAVDDGHLRRNPARAMERPTVVAIAPTELSDKQRFILKTMVEQHATPRFAAIFAASLLGRAAHQRNRCFASGSVYHQSTGRQHYFGRCQRGKTRTLDLHNMARRTLYDYLYPSVTQELERDPESAYVFTSQRAAWLRQHGRPDHLSERGVEHLWAQFKRQGTYEEWQLISDIPFHDLRHDFVHRARQSGWSLEEIAVYAGHQSKDGVPAIARTVRYTLPSRKQLKERVQLLQG
jgi:site-specific recombinase XerD